MSYTLRTARVAYDNVKVAGTAGRENVTVAGAGSTEKYGGGSNVVVASTEPTTDFARSRMVSGTGVTTLHPRENI